MVYTSQRLTFQSDRNDLLSPDLDWNKRYIEYRRRFEAQDRVVVAVQKSDRAGGREQAEKFVTSLAGRLDADPKYIRKVWWKLKRDDASAAMIRILPRDEFDRRIEEIRQSTDLLAADGPADFLASLTAKLTAQGDSANASDAAKQIATITTWIEQLRGVLTGSEERLSLDPSDDRDEYLTSDDGELLLMDIELLRQAEDMDPHEAAVAAVRSALHATRLEHPGVEAGLTGIPIMEVDETLISQRDATISTSIAAVLILIMMVIAYHSISLPLLSQAALAVGLAWSYGYLTFAIGHLQVVSIVFTVILLGLGIDFGIHVISQYELVRHRYPPDLSGFSPTLVEAMERAGPGMITGAITTSVAFATTMATGFLGMAEMGHIAAVGVLLCLVASLTVLPALMRLLRPFGHHIAPADERLIDLHAQGWLMPVVRHPWLTLGITAALALPSAWAMSQIRFDNNLMSLLPKGLESTVWQEKITEHSSQALWYAVSTTDNQASVMQYTQRFRKLPSVESVGGAGMLFPDDLFSRLETLDEVYQTIKPQLSPGDNTRELGDSSGDLLRELGKLETILPIALARKEVRSEPAIRDALQALLDEVRGAAGDLRNPTLKPESVAKLNRSFVAMREQSKLQIASALEIRPLRRDDLPPLLQREAMSAADPAEYQIKIYPKHDIWEPARLEQFLAEVRSIDPNITGSPVQIHESGLLMKESYRRSGLLALFAMLVLVFLDFRRPVDTLLSMLPVGLGFLFMFGVMWLTGESINPANVMVLPLMFGISVDNGVHILHRYQQHPFRRPLGLCQGTGKGITLTSLTAVIGFLSLTLAQHRGIRSLGFVLAVGMAMTLAASLIVMPAVLELNNRRLAVRRLRRIRGEKS